MPLVREHYDIRPSVAERPAPVPPPQIGRADAGGYRIPFNRPFVSGRELEYVLQSFDDGRLCGDGPFTKRCQRLIEERFGARQVLLTTSCTAALEMAALLIEIAEGDEVILPSYTFVSTANAFVLRGAKPVFVDIRPDTLNLDEKLVEGAVTERTKAIVPVHYAGVSCDMDAINATARRHGLYVIEDAAQGIDAKYKNAYLGTLGDLAAFSFHETKNVICGEGGALVGNNPKFNERAEFIREKGTNRSNFARGKVDKYTWVDVGSSYALSDILAAFLWGQLNSIDLIREKRKRVFELYHEAFRPLEELGVLRLPRIPEGCEPNYHMFYILLESQAARTAVIKHLQREGIQAVFHFVPLHISPVGMRLGYRTGMLPVTEDLSQRLLRLPFYCHLSEGDIETVATEVSRALLVKGLRSPA